MGIRQSRPDHFGASCFWPSFSYDRPTSDLERGTGIKSRVVVSEATGPRQFWLWLPPLL